MTEQREPSPDRNSLRQVRGPSRDVRPLFVLVAVSIPGIVVTHIATNVGAYYAAAGALDLLAILAWVLGLRAWFRGKP